ncbi:MAG TPA: FAD-dependent oxidoreductase, partial [Egibacteraceae bacterium]|nr:FAD-dependent oxidoreductase [Egibacteraceae bacterium]
FEGRALGGMAASEDHGGYLWNWGGHALYRKGPAVPVLRELGVRPRGAVIRGAAFMEALHGGAIVPAPFSARTALSPLLDGADRVDMARAMAAVPRDARGARLRALDHVTLSAWLDQHVTRERARELILALVRLSSFTHDPHRQAASAAVRQLQLALHGVWYLHGGWQQLVDGLRQAAQAAGVDVREHCRVDAVEHDERVRAVRLADGARVAVDGAVVAAGGPRAAARLLDGPGAGVVGGWAGRAVPVRAATYELNLARVPSSPHVWVLGVDQPVYVNVHSHFAAGVAPQGRTLVQVLRYLGPREPSPAYRAEIDAALDLALPGWRDDVAGDRYLPGLTVMHDTPAAAAGGLAGRPGPLVPGVEGLAVVGDWCGRRGILADAALASAKLAATALSAGAARGAGMEAVA